MYKELFLFYLKTMVLFKKPGFSVGTAWSILMADTTVHVDSFNDYAKTLDFLLNAETYSSTRELKEGMVDSLGEIPIFP